MAVRSESSRQAVLDATMDLLGQEPGPTLSVQRLTIDAIARRAGVSKATIYRWWSSKAAVVIDAFLENHLANTPVPQDGPVREALRTHVRSLVRQYAGPEGRLVAQIIAEGQYDPGALEEFRSRFWSGRVDAVIALVRRGVEQGDLDADVDAAAAAQLIYAPIYLRLLLGGGPLDDAFADQLVEVGLVGLAPAVS